MVNWKMHLISIIVSALICSIISQLIANEKRKSLIHMISGTILAISILYPLSGIRLNDLLMMPFPEKNSAEYYIAEGKKTALEAQERFIKEACEAYVLNEAQAPESKVMVKFTLNTDLIPVFAELIGEVDTDMQVRLENILAEDLDIPKENQKWIWNQESNSS